MCICLKFWGTRERNALCESVLGPFFISTCICFAPGFHGKLFCQLMGKNVGFGMLFGLQGLGGYMVQGVARGYQG